MAYFFFFQFRNLQKKSHFLQKRFQFLFRAPFLRLKNVSFHNNLHLFYSADRDFNLTITAFFSFLTFSKHNFFERSFLY